LGRDFELKQQFVELINYIRAVEEGEIRSLVFRGGLPFAMEIEVQNVEAGGA
jgi:hypothetical protein